MLVAGVDGCRTGWVAVLLDDAPRVLGEHFRGGGIKAILTAPAS